MASKFISALALNIEKYNTWKKEMWIWELATRLELLRWVPSVVLSQEGKARVAVLELDIAILNVNKGMKKLYKKLNILFLKMWPSLLLWHMPFGSYQRKMYQ